MKKGNFGKPKLKDGAMPGKMGGKLVKGPSQQLKSSKGR